ncbi:DNA-binding helix-turn-helix protein [Jonquetella anthropi E3_33 E1]|nr:DNA-binding helix-turn-helix protein [Jonquetella anthropi E3_33 E1]
MRQLADKCGVRVSSISRLENGEIWPSKYTLFKIMTALNTTLDAFAEKILQYLEYHWPENLYDDPPQTKGVQEDVLQRRLVGKALAQIRQEHGFSPQEAARNCGMSENMLQCIETGEINSLSWEIIEKLLRGYGIFAADLFYQLARHINILASQHEDKNIRTVKAVKSYFYSDSN